MTHEMASSDRLGRPQMMIEELVSANRSYRRFLQNAPVDDATMRWLISLARHSASGGNLQPLKYIISNTPAKNALVFPTTVWAGYLADWPGPAEGERPSAYIIVLGDTQISNGFGCDHGIAAQSMLLGAVEKGFGGCMIGSIHRDQLRSALSIPDRYEILLIVALGRPAEKVVLEDVGPNGSIKYYRDPDGVHHVPKRTLDELILDL